MNNDLIRRADAVEILRARAETANVGTPKLVFDAASRMIDKMPAVDAVQVVRCRDCKYYDSYYTSCNHERHDHQEFRVVQEPDDYCSYAERRSE